MLFGVGDGSSDGHWCERETGYRPNLRGEEQEDEL